VVWFTVIVVAGLAVWRLLNDVVVTVMFVVGVPFIIIIITVITSSSSSSR